MAPRTGPLGNRSRDNSRTPRYALRHFRSVCSVLTLGLLVQGFFVPVARADRQVVAVDPDGSLATDTPQVADRDSLMLEIRRYTRMIKGLRDSLSGDDEALQLPPERRERLQEDINQITSVIEQIGDELSQLEFKVKENRISLVNEAGEGIVINIPEDLDERVSKGIEAITQAILSELPDSVTIDSDTKYAWKSFIPQAPPPPKRKIVRGNLVRVRDDLTVDQKEDVRGNVIVVFGDLEVAGRVDGDVVNVFGNLILQPTAEVTGHVVAAGGTLEQDPDAAVGEVVAVDLFGGTSDWSVSRLLHRGLVSFVGCQGLFLVMVIMAVIVVAIAPRARIDNLARALRSAPGPAFGLGLVTALAGHLVIAILMAVLIITVIGLPLALLLAMVLLALLVAGVATTGLVVGEAVCRRLGGFCTSPWLVVVVGLAALHAISFLGSLLNLFGGLGGLAWLLMGLGIFVKLAAYFFGLGALVLTRLGARSVP